MKSVLIVEPDKPRGAELAQWLRDGGFDAEVVEVREVAKRFKRGADVGALVLSDRAGPQAVTSLLSIGGQHVPTIVVGRANRTAIRIAALELGADCYMSQPYSPREVLARIRALTRPFAQNSE